MFIDKWRCITMWIMAAVVLVVMGTCNLAEANWPFSLDYGMPRQKAEEIISSIKGTPTMKKANGTGWIKDVETSPDYSYRVAEITTLTFINDKLYEFIQIKVFCGVGNKAIDKAYTNAKLHFGGLVKEVKADKKHPIIEELPVFLKADYGNGTARFIGADKKKGNVMGRPMEGLEIIDGYGPNTNE